MVLPTVQIGPLPSIIKLENVPIGTAQANLREEILHACFLLPSVRRFITESSQTHANVKLMHYVHHSIYTKFAYS